MPWKSKSFDVAMWCYADIAMCLEGWGKDVTEENCDLVVDYLSSNFDANVGINWSVITDAIFNCEELTGSDFNNMFIDSL